MATKIYNEGRVTGYSAYEMYVRQFLLTYPNGIPASEKAWLASSLAMGSSLVITVPKTASYSGITHGIETVQSVPARGYVIVNRIEDIIDIVIDRSTFNDNYLRNVEFLVEDQTRTYTALEIIQNPNDAIAYFNQYNNIKISNDNSVDFRNNLIQIVYSSALDDKYHTIDINLPLNTRLRAANTIYGTYTNIELNSGERVSVYSNQLIPNNSTKHPNVGYTQASNLPTDVNKYTGISATESRNILDYLKIQDAVVLQGGNWSEAPDEDKPPECVFTPDLTTSPVVRLLIKGYVMYPFNILLTGFTDLGVIAGVSGLSGSVSPKDGDFLGPATYPWANKVILTLNNQYLLGISQNSSSIYVDNQITDSKYIKLGSANVPIINRTSYSSDLTEGDVLATNAGSGALCWAQLFQALPEDKRIQIVSNILLLLSDDLSLPNTDYTLAYGKSLKVGKNYIDFNGVRFYVSNEVPSVYTLLPSEPSNWSTNYTNYYTYDSVTNTYSPVPTQDPAPTFTLNTYYDKSLDDTVPNGSIGIGWSSTQA